MTQGPPDPANERLQAFFRENIMAEPGMSTELADKLAGRCVTAIDQTLTTHAEKSVLSQAVPEKPQPPSFDPFAFSVVAMLARLGRDELMSRLNTIPAIDNLRTLALAQHIYVDPTLAVPDDVRLAIVRGAEHRIASRRAAAS